MIVVALGAVSGFAQKFALVDMDYILSNVPTYEIANDQLNQLSQRWQKEVEAINKQAETMYKDYQNNMVFLSDEQKKKQEEAITAKEKEAMELRNKYFPKANSTQCARNSCDLFRTRCTTPSRL